MHWHLQWCSHGRSHLESPKHWSLEKKEHWTHIFQRQISQSDCDISTDCGKKPLEHDEGARQNTATARHLKINICALMTLLRLLLFARILCH